MGPAATRAVFVLKVSDHVKAINKIIKWRGGKGLRTAIGITQRSANRSDESYEPAKARQLAGWFGLQ